MSITINMVINTVFNEYELPVEIRNPIPYPDKKVFHSGFKYNGKTHVSYYVYRYNCFCICELTGQVILSIPLDQSYPIHIFGEFIAIDNNVLWVSLVKKHIMGGETYCYYLIDLQTLNYIWSDTIFPTDKIKPIGTSYWYIQTKSTLHIYKWEDLKKLDSLIKPVYVDNPTAQYYPVTWYGSSFVRFNKSNPFELEFLNMQLEPVFRKNVFDIICKYSKPEYIYNHNDQDICTIKFDDTISGLLLSVQDVCKSTVVINDNCLVLHELWMIMGMGLHVYEKNCYERIFCWDFTNNKQVFFASDYLDFNVTKVLPIRNSNQICLWSYKNISNTNWINVYYPKADGNNVLGKRKPESDAER